VTLAVAGADVELRPVECEYIGHRKVRVRMQDYEAASLLGFSFAGSPATEDVDELPGLVRRRVGKVAMRKLLVARERTRVRFWNRVHVGHVELTGLEARHRDHLGKERVEVSFTIEQAYALWLCGEAGRRRYLDLAAGFNPDPAACQAAQRGLDRIWRGICAVIRKHRETRNTREWFWGSCKNPDAWLAEKIAREKIHGRAGEC
jgi:hypothetical protein